MLPKSFVPRSRALSSTEMKMYTRQFLGNRLNTFLQGRQDLNLQPAVLETAALPVELRPFAVGKTCPVRPRPTQCAEAHMTRAPSIR